MARDAKVAGSEFLREVLVLLPAEQRGAIETVLADPAAAAALTRIGEGTLRQSEYDRLADGARKVETDAKALLDSNTAWFADQKANLTELDQIRARLAAGEIIARPGDGTVTPPAKLPDNLVTKDMIAKEFDQFSRDAAGFVSDMNRLSLQHYIDFKEVLDDRALMADPRISKIGLNGVYNEVYKEKLTAKSAAATKAAEDAIRLDERNKVMAAQNGQHIPYPTRGNETSTLDGLEAAPGKPVVGKTAEEMASEYTRLGAARTGASA